MSKILYIPLFYIGRSSTAVGPFRLKKHRTVRKANVNIMDIQGADICIIFNSVGLGSMCIKRLLC